MRNRGRKRGRGALEDDDQARISPPRELPIREAAAVSDALERWKELRARAEELRPVLQREDALMQEILDRGLRHEDRRTLRRLVSGSSEEVEEEAAQQVAAAIGSEMQALQALLVRNRRELLELSATTVPERKRDLVTGLDAVRSELQGAQDTARGELLAAKERGETAVVRSVGRSFNDLKALLQRVEGDRRKLTRNSALAALLVTVCRRVLPVRHIDPSKLRDIPPSHEGYLRIADFHLFSDSGLYDFGEHCSGPNLFTRLRRNVAILLVHDKDGQVVYNAFAVSGELKCAGVPLVPPNGPLYSVEAEDEHGRTFDRRHDAEFKLLSGFCAALEDIVDGWPALDAGGNTIRPLLKRGDVLREGLPPCECETDSAASTVRPPPQRGTDARQRPPVTAGSPNFDKVLATPDEIRPQDADCADSKGRPQHFLNEIVEIGDRPPAQVAGNIAEGRPPLVASPVFEERPPLNAGESTLVGRPSSEVAAAEKRPPVTEDARGRPPSAMPVAQSADINPPASSSTQPVFQSSSDNRPHFSESKKSRADETLSEDTESTGTPATEALSESTDRSPSREADRLSPLAKRQRTANAKDVSSCQPPALSTDDMPDMPDMLVPRPPVRRRVADREPSRAAREWQGSCRLWSRKPLCRSCAGAVRQLCSRFPRLTLQVTVGENDDLSVMAPASQ